MNLLRCVTLLFVFITIDFIREVSTEVSVSLSEVLEAIKNASNYVAPSNNNAFFTDDFNSKPMDFGSYDFIIVGGGTAGGVLANRLTEEKFTVLVIEAGREDPAWSSILALVGISWDSDIDWGYSTTRQTQSCLGGKDQKCRYPRGKCLGGTSATNGGMYVRGNKHDYDKWEKMGNPGWSYKDCLPYFKKSERARFTTVMDREYHGFDGPQSIGIPPDTPGLTTTLLEAFEELGKMEKDYNGLSQNCVSRTQLYVDFNIRSSTSHAFIRPATNRTNLKITLESLVTKIKISSDRRAYGVEFVKNGKSYFVTAQKEVIVSAGSINSPQVLMLSGIGPKEELKKHGIKVIADLPVGENLYDHIFFPRLIYRTNHTFFNNTVATNYELWKQGKLPFNTASTEQIVSFMNYDGSADSRPEAEVFVSSPFSATGLRFNDENIEASKTLNQYTDISMNVILLHPHSIGKVTLKSNDAREFPLIDTNYLSDPKDIENIYNAIQSVLKLDNTNTFKNWHAEFLPVSIPGCDMKYEKFSKDWWYCGIRHLAVSVFHPIGTTRMGSNPINSVVNSELKVHGIQNLRVVDAGVIPSTTSGHTNAPVVMIAEKIADIIKAEHTT